LSDLHGSRAGENISRLPHETSRVDFSARSNDLGLSDPLLLGSRGQGRGYFGAEDDILDEDTLDGDTPLVGNVSHNLCNLECNGLALRDDALDSACADDVSERGLCAFDQGLS